MRNFIFVLLAFLSTEAAWANDVVIVSIFGKEMGVKKQDFEAVNSKIGELISDFQLNKFEIIAYGIEGGYQACLQPNPYIDAAVIANEMASVQVGENETLYSVEIRANCRSANSALKTPALFANF